jgi:predicted membrane protein
MLNKKTVMVSGVIILLLGIVLSAVLPEAVFLHAAFQLLVVAVVLLSAYMSVKDILIVVLIAVSVVLGMGFFEIIQQVPQLMFETGTIIMVLLVLEFYENGHKEEHHRVTVISNYKKNEVDNLKVSLEALNAENHVINENIKEIRKILG